MKKGTEFSKRILFYICLECMGVTLLGFGLAFYCVSKDYAYTLPWIATLVSSAWASFGTATAFYLNMAKSDHKQGGITYLQAEKSINNENLYP